MMKYMYFMHRAVLCTALCEESPFPAAGWAGVSKGRAAHRLPAVLSLFVKPLTFIFAAIFFA